MECLADSVVAGWQIVSDGKFAKNFYIQYINRIHYRKGGLLLNNVLGIAGACLMGFTKVSHSYEVLFLGRFIIGLNCGMLSEYFIV